MGDLTSDLNGERIGVEEGGSSDFDNGVLGVRIGDFRDRVHFGERDDLGVLYC